MARKQGAQVGRGRGVGEVRAGRGRAAWPPGRLAPRPPGLRAKLSGLPGGHTGVARGHTSGQAPPYEKWFKWFTGRSHWSCAVTLQEVA